jgi:hypothetical protein
MRWLVLIVMCWALGCAGQTAQESPQAVKAQAMAKAAKAKEKKKAKAPNAEEAKKLAASLQKEKMRADSLKRITVGMTKKAADLQRELRKEVLRRIYSQAGNEWDVEVNRILSLVQAHASDAFTMKLLGSEPPQYPVGGSAVYKLSSAKEVDIAFYWIDEDGIADWRPTLDGKPWPRKKWDWKGSCGTSTRVGRTALLCIAFEGEVKRFPTAGDAGGDVVLKEAFLAGDEGARKQMYSFTDYLQQMLSSGKARAAFVMFETVKAKKKDPSAGSSGGQPGRF